MAPKGNKYAVGNAGGAPRTVTPLEPDLIELGKEMIAWLSEHPEANHVSDWYSCIKGIYSKVWELYCAKPEFQGYYDQALKMVRRNYLNGKVPPAIANRFMRLYFQELKEEEDGKMRMEYELKAESDKLKGVSPSDNILTDLLQSLKAH